MPIDETTGEEKYLNRNIIVNPDGTKSSAPRLTTNLNKTYVEGKDIDIAKFEEERKKGVGYNLTPETYLKNAPKIEAYEEKQKVLLNDYMADNQSTMDKIGNGFIKLGGRVFTSVAGSTVGTLYGLAAWAKDGEFKSFYDNEFQRGLDGINDYLAEEFKHYYTSSKDDWEIGNFVFDKVFDGLGFATGAVLSSMIGGGVTNALMKSFKLTGALKTGTVKALKETHNLKKGMSTYSKIDGVESALKSSAFKSNLAKLPQSASSLVTGAVYESGVEARHGYSETREYLIDAYKQMHEGKTPTGEDLDEINKLAGETANGIFAANMVVVGTGNILQFGKHLGLDFKDLKKAFTPSIAKEVVDETGKKVYKSAGSKLLRGTAAVLKNPIVESQEEMIQSVISGTGKEYALAKYNNDGIAENGMFINASIKAFKKTYGSAEGWEEGLIGAIVGSAGVVAPRSRTKADGTKQLPVTLAGGIRESVKEWRASETRRDELISNLNDKGSIESLKAGIQHNIREVRNEKLKDEAVKLDNELLFKNVQDDQFHSYVTSRHSAGMESSIYEDLQTLRNQPLEDFKKTFGIISEDYTEEQRSKEINSYERRARKIADTIKFIDRIYTENNPTNREALIYDQSMVNRIEERQTTILNEINELTGGKATSLNVRNEKGERLSKEELFKDVEKKYKAVNEKVYNQLYEDYVSLSKRSDNMLDELYEILHSKEESQVEKALKEAEAKREQTRRDVQKDKENKKRKKEKEVKSEKVKKEASKKDEEAKKSAEVVQEAEKAGMSKESETTKDDYENEIGLSPQDVDILYNNINKINDKEEFKKFFQNLQKQYGSRDLLPTKVINALNKKIDQFNKEVAENNQQKLDPVNASGNTVEDDITKHNKEVEANSTELNEEPFDVSKNLDKENTNKDILDDANQGKTKTTINDEEVREDGEGINYIDGLLVSAFNTVATSTRLYRQEDGKIIRLNENNTSANLDVLSVNLMQAGDKLEIRLYTEPTLQIKDGEGNIIGEEINETGVNQIMEIVDPNNGRVVGYVHKDSYIRPDRVVETIKDTDNIALNKQLLQQFRQQVFDYHNNNNGKPYPVTIMDKSAGSIFHVSSEYNVKLTDAIQDDSRPEIVVVKPDGLYIGRVKLKDHEIGSKVNVEFKDDFYEKFKGSTMIALPTANGSYKLTFARNPKLSETSKAKEIITIAKAFVTKDFTLIASVLNDSVLDEQTLSELPANELRNIISSFIQRYTYVKNSDYTSKYRLDLQTDNTIIFRDMENTQSLILSADGTNTISNLKAFEQKINNSLLVVDLASISDNPTIIVRDSEGNSKKVKYKQFLKENLKVSFKGNNTELSNGKTEMTYVANPVIALEHDSTPRISAVGITPKTSPDETGGLFTKEEFLKEAKQLKPVTDVSNQPSQVKPDRTTANDSLKAKKASLELKKEKELKPLNDLIQEKKGALNVGNDRNSVSIGEGFNTIIDKVELTDEEWKEARRKNKEEDSKIITKKEHRIWRLDFEKRVAARLQKEINDKYDAELAALEQQSFTTETSSLKETTNKLKKSSLGKLTNKKIRKEDAEVLPLLDVEPTEESKKREEDCKKGNN